MNVLVLGGAGLLGSHVADELTARGHDVTIFDCRRSPYLHGGQRMLVGNILDEDALRRAVAGFEVVYNFAGFTGTR